MSYSQRVSEARTLVKRTEADQWRLAELSWQAVKEDGRTQMEWAGDIGTSQVHVSYLVKIHDHYNQVIDRPSFRDAYAEAKGLPVGTQERREMEAVSNIRKATPERRREVARELLNDPEVASDPGVRARVTSGPSPERLEQQRQFDERQRQQHKRHHGLRFLDVESDLANARQKLRHALTESEGVEFDTEERELLSEAIGQVQAVLNLLKVRIVGAADIDWDAEMSKLGDLS